MLWTGSALNCSSKSGARSELMIMEQIGVYCVYDSLCFDFIDSIKFNCGGSQVDLSYKYRNIQIKFNCYANTLEKN